MQTGGLKKLLEPHMRWALFLGVMLSVIQQYTGVVRVTTMRQLHTTANAIR
jgi:hypothetical protein